MRSILGQKLNRRGPTVWVKKWVDYSSKYGLGYTLSNGACGVYFNDNSKILRDAAGKLVTYVERHTASRQEQIDQYQIDEAPKEIRKKVLLLKHFAEYLEGSKDEFQDESEPEQPVATGRSSAFAGGNAGAATGAHAGLLSPKAAVEKNVVMVKKWMRTKHAILFRLNNKVVQVCFQDNSQIILCSDSRLVCYVSRQGMR